jgi:hypothetical protein
VILGDRSVIAERARMRSIAFDVAEYRGRDSAPAVSVLALPVAKPITPGRLDAANARHVLALLDRAIEGCRAREFDAMVTAPVQKSVLNDAGVAFTGHTEYLAERTATPLVVMLLVGGGCASRSPRPISRSPKCRAPSLASGSNRSCASSMGASASASASRVRGSSSPDSIRTPASRAISGARRSR